MLFIIHVDFVKIFSVIMRPTKVLNFVNVNVISDLNKKNELFEELIKYVSISFTDRPSSFLYSNEIMKNPSYNNHYLFSQLICE